MLIYLSCSSGVVMTISHSASSKYFFTRPSQRSALFSIGVNTMICLLIVGTLGPNIGWHGSISTFSGAYFTRASAASVFTLQTSISNDPSLAWGATSLIVSAICSIGTLKITMSAFFTASTLSEVYSTFSS